MASVDTTLPEEITAVTERSSDGQLSKDVIFELLKNRRRREVLAYLLDTEGTVTLGELAEQIAAWENDIEVAALNSDQRKRVYVALYQTHLPKMDDAGIVDYDQDRGLIDLADNADLLMMYLDSDAHRTDRWDRVYVAVSLLGLATLTGAVLGVPALSAISTAIVAGAIVASFCVISLVHVVVNHRQQRSVDGRLARIE